MTVPTLAKGYGYWVVIRTSATGTVSATWAAGQTAARLRASRWAAVTLGQSRLALYAGNPFAGRSDPVKAGRPSGALASATLGQVLSVSATGRPAGTYTAYFYSSSGRSASTGSTTGLQLTCAR